MDANQNANQLAIGYAPVSVPPDNPQQTEFTRIKEWLYRTDHTLGVCLDWARRNWGADPLCTAVMIAFGLVWWMVLDPEWASVTSQFICCCTYPLFESIQALKYRDRDGLRIWNVYWYVYHAMGTLDVLEHLTLLYWPLKTMAVVYLFLPPTQYISIIYDAWLMPVLELVYGELHIETLRWAHPVVLRSMGLNHEQIKDWNQDHLKTYLSQCKLLFYLVMLRMHQVCAEAMDISSSQERPLIADLPQVQNQGAEGQGQVGQGQAGQGQPGQGQAGPGNAQ